MLALAKVAQLRQQPDLQTMDLAQVVRSDALDLAPLFADENIQFEIKPAPAPVASHEWVLGELTRNLLHNAIRHTPAGSKLAVRVTCESNEAVLTISDSRPGASAALFARLYQPFSACNVGRGSGLGLAICHEITPALGGSIRLKNRLLDGRVIDLEATARLPQEL